MAKEEVDLTKLGMKRVKKIVQEDVPDEKGNKRLMSVKKMVEEQDIILDPREARKIAEADWKEASPHHPAKFVCIFHGERFFCNENPKAK